jgi:hypothetical protein
MLSIVSALLALLGTRVPGVENPDMQQKIMFIVIMHDSVPLMYRSCTSAVSPQHVEY